MTPDELKSFLLPHTSEICRTTPALFRYIPGRVNHFGSGVLLRVGEIPFLLTAAHVADEFRDMNWKGIYFGTPDCSDLLPIDRVQFLCSKRGTDPFRGDDPIDVAVVELSQDVAGKLSEFMRFLVLDDLLLEHELLKQGTYLVNGFPDFRVDKDEMEEAIVAENLPYITYLHEHEKYSIPNFNPLNNIALEAHKPYEDGGFSFGIDLDYTEGMSGGGIWRLYDEGLSIQALDWKKAKLVGILTEGSDPDYIGPTDYFRGTKLRCLIRLLRRGWPHLELVLLKSISPRFVNGPDCDHIF